jgi:4a-hydroxytetrahydrobiopterin dehydratase
VNRLLTEPDVSARLADLPDFAAALAFVNAVGAEAEQRNHHPDIDIRWNTVTLVLSTHSEGGLTEADFDLAAVISRLPR